MTTIRLAAAALNQTPMAWDSNRQHIVTAITGARDAGASVLCLPECCISGYGCEDAFFAKGVGQTSLDLLREIVPETGGMAVALGLPLHWQGVILNAAALACDGRLIGFAIKQNLAGYGIHYEPRWFQPWIPGKIDQVLVGETHYPIGDLLFDTVRLQQRLVIPGVLQGQTGAVAGRRGEQKIIIGVGVVRNIGVDVEDAVDLVL